MKLFEKRMSTGWSFALGMLFGALLVFAKIGTSSVTQVSGHSSSSPSRAMDPSSHATSLPSLDPKGTNEKPSPAASAGAKSRSETTPSRDARHSECELQLD